NSPAAAGVHLNTPVRGSIVAPAGGVPLRENVFVWPASISVAFAVNVNSVPTFIDLLRIESNTGAKLVAAVTVTASSSNKTGTPLSLTLTLTVNTPLVAGVNLNTPVTGSIVAPANKGATKENVFVWAESYSVAFAVNVSSVPVLTCLLRMESNTGASLFTAKTVIKTFAGGEEK